MKHVKLVFNRKTKECDVYCYNDEAQDVETFKVPLLAATGSIEEHDRFYVLDDDSAVCVLMMKDEIYNLLKACILSAEVVDFKSIWLRFIEDNDCNYNEYVKASNEHIGWLYSYESPYHGSKCELRFQNHSKEQAFYLAMDLFKDKYGQDNVIEDDVDFEPLFNGKTIKECE